jgi:hypothetical protein
MNKGTIVMRKLVAVFAGLGLIIAAFAGLALAFVIGIAAAGAMLVARLTGRLGPSTDGVQPHNALRRASASPIPRTIGSGTTVAAPSSTCKAFLLCQKGIPVTQTGYRLTDDTGSAFQSHRRFSLVEPDPKAQLNRQLSVTNAVALLFRLHVCYMLRQRQTGPLTHAEI